MDQVGEEDRYLEPKFRAPLVDRDQAKPCWNRLGEFAWFLRIQCQRPGMAHLLFSFWTQSTIWTEPTMAPRTSFQDEVFRLITLKLQGGLDQNPPGKRVGRERFSTSLLRRI